MTILRIAFAGTIMKAEHKMAGDKPLCEVSLCKKHKGRNGGEDTFTWLRVALFSPAEFQTAKLVKGNFIAGSGELQLRSFEHKGEKRQSLECRSTSFDVEVSDGARALSDGDTAVLPPTQAAAVAREMREKAQAGGGSAASDDGIPFMRLGEWW